MVTNNGYSSAKTGFYNLVNGSNYSEDSVKFTLEEDDFNFIREDYVLQDGELEEVCRLTNMTGCCQNEEEFLDVVTESISSRKSDEYINSWKKNYKVRSYEELIAISILKREGELSSYDLPIEYQKSYV